MLPKITPSQRQVVVELLDLGVDRETIAAQVGVDCGQGFAVESSPRQFGEYARPIELRASLEGVAINPLQLFPADVHDPVNVAQRVADTFQRVYPQIGV